MDTLLQCSQPAHKLWKLIKIHARCGAKRPGPRTHPHWPVTRTRTVLRVQQMASSDDELTWSEAQIADCIIKRKLRVQLTIFQQKTEQVSVELITHSDSQTATEKMRRKHTDTHTDTSLVFVLTAVAQFSTNIYFKWSLWHARPGGTMSLVCTVSCLQTLDSRSVISCCSYQPWLHLLVVVVVASFPHSIFSSFWLLLPTPFVISISLLCLLPLAGISSATQYTRREALRVQHKIQIY